MIPETALDPLFRSACSHNGWLARPVSDATLRALHDLVKWGPTSANCCPMRVVFVTSDSGRARLRPWISPGNVDKVMGAPVTAIIGYDLAFSEQLTRLFPHRPMLREAFEGPENAAHAEQTALRNSSLQAGYFILAARSLGLDCGPQSGFDAQGVNDTFWAGTTIRTNILCNLGHGDPDKLFARHPRLEVDEVCRFE